MSFLALTTAGLVPASVSEVQGYDREVPCYCFLGVDRGIIVPRTGADRQRSYIEASRSSVEILRSSAEIPRSRVGVQ